MEVQMKSQAQLANTVKHTGTVKVRELKELFQFGNKKLPKSTAIFNMGPASICPSLKKGLCQAFVGDKCVCYAMKAERLYPQTLPYRMSQRLYWGKHSAEQFVAEFRAFNSRRKNKIQTIRFNESGDFWSQKCIDKAEAIAKELKEDGVTCYCYTARKDLDFTGTDALIVYGSGYHKEGQSGEFKMIETRADNPKGYVICPGDCKTCDMCLKGVAKISVPKH
jgi:hypothetical protein